MKTKALDIPVGFPWIDFYMDVEIDGSPALSSVYELQFQVLDQDDLSVLVSAEISPDGSVDGRYWPSLTAEETTTISLKDSIYIVLMREKSNPDIIRTIAEGEINLTFSSGWAT